MKGMLEWVAENPEMSLLVVSVIVNVLLGKWALVRDGVARLLVRAGEKHKMFRGTAEKLALDATGSVRDSLANSAARSDPKPEKRAENPAKAFGKLVLRTGWEAVADRITKRLGK